MSASTNGTHVESASEHANRQCIEAMENKAKRLMRCGHTPANVYSALLVTAARMANLAKHPPDRFRDDAIAASLLVRGMAPMHEISEAEAQLIAAKVRGEES